MISFWKASECKMFLTCTGPVILFQTLSDRHFSHFYLLSTCIRRLAGPVQIDDLPAIEKCLKMFVQFYEAEFGIVHMSINVHLLLHLVSTVRNFGPLSGYSAFSFESANGQLARLAKGKRHKCKSTVGRYLLKTSASPPDSKKNVSVSGIIFQESDKTQDPSASCFLKMHGLPSSSQLFSKIRKENGVTLSTKKYCSNLKFKNCWVTGFCSINN